MNIIKFDKECFKTIFFYLLLFLLSIVFTVSANNYDNDIWSRLISGMAIVQTGHILKYDFLSFTPTHEWFDHEWLSGVLFYITQSKLGHIGILFLQIIIIFVTMVFFVQAVKIKYADKIDYKNILISFVVLKSFLSTYASPIRCQSFTILFFMIELYILEKIRKTGDNKLFYILPLLFLFWANMHGGVFAGLGILILYTIGEYLNKKSFKYYIIFAFICFLTLFINPYGIDYVKFLLYAVNFNHSNILEWSNLFSLGYKIYMPFALLMLSYIMIEFIKCFKNGFSYVKLDKTKFLVIAVTLYLAVSHIKMISFFALAVPMFCYSDIYLLFKNIKFPKYTMQFVNVGFLVYSIIVISSTNFIPLIDYNHYPVLETEFVRKNHINGKILTSFANGAYVSYKLYPQNTIYMDGRYETVYENKIPEDLKNFEYLNKDYEYILRKYNPDIILLSKNKPAFQYMKTENKDYFLVFTGFNYGVFIKWNKYRNDFQNPSGDLKYYRNTVFDTNITFTGKNAIDINKINGNH